MIGALTEYITNEYVKDFQPMGSNMGILPDLPEKIRDKKMKYMAYADRALNSLSEYLQSNRES